MSENFVVFKKEVCKRLIELDMTRSQLAEMMGVSKPYLTDLLNGNRRYIKQLHRIAYILELDPKMVPVTDKQTASTQEIDHCQKRR